MRLMRTYDISAFGAVADGVRDNAREIQRAINECSETGGGTVLVPGPGVFMTGPFDLRSNVTLSVDATAVLLANPDETVYTKSAFKENRGEGSIWIGGEREENITITGRGVIDGNGIAFMGPEEKPAYALKPFSVVDPRPHLLTLVGCRNVLIRDVTFRNAAYWGLHLIGCDDVRIESVTIRNHLKIRNGDGIDIDHSRNVRITNCDIESGDDCVCLKTRREYEEWGPTENVLVSHCLMTSTSCSIKLGSENMDAIRNVIITDCIIRSSNRGIGIQNRDEGVVENVLFRNIIVEGRLFDDVWWGKAEPIYITAYKRKASAHKDANIRFAKGQTVGKVGRVKGITFSGIRAESENGCFIGGEPGMVEDVVIEDSSFLITKKTAFAGGIYDLRPSDTVGLLETETSAFLVRTAGNVEIRNCSVAWGKERPAHFGRVLVADDVEGLTVSRLKGESAVQGKEPFLITNCRHVVLEGE